jgi:hypothetical protein
MLGLGNFVAAEALANQVLDIRDAAFEADRLIDELEDLIYRSSLEGFDTSQASSLFDEALKLFSTDNYMESSEKLQQGIDLLETMQQQAALEESLQDSPGEQITLLVTDYWYAILAFLIAAFLGYLVSRKLKKDSALRKRLSRLERERASLSGLVSKTQVRYFTGNSLSKTDYEDFMEQYGRRLANVDKEISAIKHGSSPGKAPKQVKPGKQFPAVKTVKKAIPEKLPREDVHHHIGKAEEAIKAGKHDLAHHHYKKASSFYKALDKSSKEAGLVYKRMRQVYDKLVG